MSKRLGTIRCACILMVSALATLHAQEALAVDGIALTGTGVMAAGMGGTSIAFPQDSTAAADNPAGMGLIGSRTDFGIQLLEPLTDFDYGSPSNHLHTGKVYPVPNGGANWQISPRLTLGVSLFGVGVGTSYGRPALPIAGAGVAQSSLQTVIAAPTITWRLTPHNIIGASLALAYERFSANGAIVPTDSGGLQPLPSHGISNAFGYGVRLGYIWQPTSAFTFGASYASRIRMSRLSGYDDDLLAAGGGRIDIGAQYGVGIAYRIVPSLTLAADWLHLEFSNTVVGSAQGFGWQNQDIFRVGAAWNVNSRWTLRAGFSRGNHPIGPSVVAQNLLAAMPCSTSVSAGATWRLNKADDISGVVEYDFATNVKGTGASAGFDMRTRAEIIGVSYGHRF
ncbi:aromatic hydrocarbon degradation protein [Pandoraea thiooxydans]|uniref:Aromatic hydrocarbon degradation protein n=2 Tax=Pandoraea thiooxydans TaxID=445709 RepID=A0A0G3ELX5_9BURK|nr:aromatic hydrocarbon degradation protein [Pandoraea thiooxydans]APR93876.1 aromatic hydrocarbon degradation protein [Pandoraea thiooxydans]